MNEKFLWDLINFYHYINFETLSKFKIKDEPTTNDAKWIFLLSNALHNNRKKNYIITEQDKEYFNKILLTNGKR